MGVYKEEEWCFKKGIMLKKIVRILSLKTIILSKFAFMFILELCLHAYLISFSTMWNMESEWSNLQTPVSLINHGRQLRHLSISTEMERITDEQ